MVSDRNKLLKQKVARLSQDPGQNVPTPSLTNVLLSSKSQCLFQEIHGFQIRIAHYTEFEHLLWVQNKTQWTRPWLRRERVQNRCSMRQDHEQASIFCRLITTQLGDRVGHSRLLVEVNTVPRVSPDVRDVTTYQ